MPMPDLERATEGREGENEIICSVGFCFARRCICKGARLIVDPINISLTWHYVDVRFGNVPDCRVRPLLEGDVTAGEGASGADNVLRGEDMKVGSEPALRLYCTWVTAVPAVIPHWVLIAVTS